MPDYKPCKTNKKTHHHSPPISPQGLHTIGAARGNPRATWSSRHRASPHQHRHRAGPHGTRLMPRARRRGCEQGSRRGHYSPADTRQFHQQDGSTKMPTVLTIQSGIRRGSRLTSSGSKHMRESAASRTLVPDEAPPPSPLGLRAAAREDIEDERESPEEEPPPAAGGWERRAASSASTRVRSSRGGAIFVERSSGREWTGGRREDGKRTYSVVVSDGNWTMG